MRLNSAIVGLGWWGKHIVNTLQDNSEKIHFSRAMDTSPELVRNFAISKNIELSDKFTDILADEQIDSVVLATPHSLHEKQIIEVAKSGKHVFCEKPLALNLASAERAVKVVKDMGVILGLGHERRFEPAMQEIERLVRGGDLGQIMHVEANFSHDKLANLQSTNWRVSKTESPAAAMTATGIHLTDSFVNMFGAVKEVYAQIATRNAANANGDILNFNLRFENGATGSFNSILETPLYMRYAVFGSNAWAESRDYSHPSEDGPTDLFVCRSEGQIETRNYKYVDTVKLNFEAWADAILGNAVYPITLDQSLNNIAIFDAICESSETRLPVTL